MTQEHPHTGAVSLLNELGLTEYEARCFVALTQLSSGTAKEISNISEVPRTRVYDAIEVLEARGLVAVHHSSPQQFRAVSIDEATQTLRQTYDSRIDTLETHLQDLEAPVDSEDRYRQEVWSLTGHNAIQTRTEDVLAEADAEIVLLVVEEALLTDALTERLQAATDRDVTVIVGGATDAIMESIEAALPAVQVFETELDWLLGPATDDEVAISRMLLADRETLLVGSFYPHTGETRTEQAVYATGLTNGLVKLLRRLVATGLPATRDAGR